MQGRNNPPVWGPTYYHSAPKHGIITTGNNSFNPGIEHCTIQTLLPLRRRGFEFGLASDDCGMRDMERDDFSAPQDFQIIFQLICCAAYFHHCSYCYTIAGLLLFQCCLIPFLYYHFHVSC